MKRKSLVFSCVLFAVLLTWFLFFRTASNNAQEGESPQTSARLYAAVAPGLVEPASEERRVGSEIIGTLRSVEIEENDKVRANQVIAVVKNDDQKAMLAQAKAQLNAARATLVEAKQDYHRDIVLEKSNAVSMSQLDTAHKNFDVARAGVEKAKASEELAKADLDKTFIRSPIDGVVLKKLVVSGEAVSNQPPTLIAVIGDLSSLRVRAEVDELDIGKVHNGQRVEIKADAFPGLKAGGTVIRVDKCMGPRRVQTDRSDERIDSKVLQTIIELDKDVSLPIGLRVDVYYLPNTNKG